jgi:hypothetical protein
MSTLSILEKLQRNNIQELISWINRVRSANHTPEDITFETRKKYYQHIGQIRVALAQMTRPMTGYLSGGDENTNIYIGGHKQFEDPQEIVNFWFYGNETIERITTGYLWTDRPNTSEYTSRNFVSNAHLDNLERIQRELPSETEINLWAVKINSVTFDQQFPHLLDIARKLSTNIETTANGRITSGKNSDKLAKLHNFIIKLESDSQYKRKEYTQFSLPQKVELIKELWDICSITRNKWHFFGVPHSLRELKEELDLRVNGVNNLFN